VYFAPATIPLAANAADRDGIAKVEFYQGAQLIGTSFAAPYTGSWANVAAGNYTLTAKAYDTQGAATLSAPVHVTVSSGSTAGATATFAGVDSTTQGSWRGSYGAQGYGVVGDSSSWPAWATVTPGGQAQYQFAATTGDVRGLQQASGASRVASVWYGDSWTLDVNLSDGQTHQLGLYLVDWDTTARAQRMEVRDAANGTLLDTQNASGYNGGQYWRWRITGHVTITLIKTAGWNAVVSGIFLDALGSTPPIVSLTAPGNGASYTAPASIALAANATDSDGVAKVEFYETPAQGQPTLIGQALTTAPYQITWTNAPAGTYTLTAKAYDTLGATATSAAVQVTVSAASSGGGTSATFAGLDSTTQGSWRGSYGAQGYTVVGDSSSWPAWATVTPAGQAQYQFAASTSDVRGLQQANGASRVASVWYGDSWTLDVNVTDGQAHQLGLYLVDWDTTTRAQRMEVRDAVSGTVLDTQNASSYNGGQYWRWRITGHVKITLIKTAGWNAVVSGVFLDSAGTPPTVSMTAPANGATYTAPASIALAANATDSDGVAKVEFYETPAQGQATLIGQAVTTAPYQITWSNVPAGIYTLTAKAYDTLGAVATSTSVQVTVSGAGGGATATFAGVDATTQGNWHGVYGAIASTVVGDSASWPPWATMTPAGQALYQFASSTNDVRGLQQAAGASRVAYVWYADSWTLDVNVTDGQAHQLALYLVDWDTTTRAQRMEVRDAVSGALLDAQNASDYNGGQYWRWNITGHVKLMLIKTAGWNAVVSGVFLN
jgi:hypothetical protein